MMGSNYLPERWVFWLISDLVIKFKNESIFGTLFIFINAKLGNLEIEGLKDKINQFLNSSIRPVSNFHAIPRHIKVHSHFFKLNDEV